SEVAQSSSVVSIDAPVIHSLLPWRPIDSDFDQMRNCNANEVCRKDRKDGLRVDRRLESPVPKMALDA
ncbi:hypothetical protein U1708_19795, partial [Sphingomonas sp. ZB1N12]|uniref:hypothetical protein n=1 Tax=Sphingomonas arabinosi TaxID=3096160 RepID=UPI002FCC9E8B